MILFSFLRRSVNYNHSEHCFIDLSRVFTMIGEENIENIDKTSSEEELAQFRYENKRLKEELDTLRRNSFGIEENLNCLSDDMRKKDSTLKRSEQKIKSLNQTIKEKDNSIDALERKLEETLNTIKNLEFGLARLRSEKEELTEQNDLFSVRERELIEEHRKIEMELSGFIHKFDLLSEENTCYRDLMKDLQHQIKVLEEEKLLLQERVPSEKYEAGSPLQSSPGSGFSGSITSSPVLRRLDFTLSKDACSYDVEFDQLNLKEELLITKIDEKQMSIRSLEEKLDSSERIIQQLSRLIRDRLKEAIDVIILFWNNANEDFELIFPPLRSHFERFIDEFRKWSDGQSGENNPLTEITDSIKIKEVVISAQPAQNRTVESVNIATQTDRTLLARALEELSPIHNVPNHKYNDVDMDLYRSYRKLSVLPEEEDDESFKRIPSLKNSVNSNAISAKLPDSYKTHSADDLLKFEKQTGKPPPSEKLISSCTNIVLSVPENVSNCSKVEFFQGSPRHDGGFPIICDNKLSDDNNFKSEANNSNNLAPVDALEALRQPHSFDSYLDPQQIQVIQLPRQISDPVQSSASDETFTRRGSYLKRPRSTCRPLRLPCEENETKREERVSKVRFDLSEKANSKSSDNTNGSKGPTSNLKNARKIERISRFTVEKVDEDEFRKSIDELSKSSNRKRPPLIHSVVYKKSVLHDITFYDPESSITSSDELKRNITGSPDSPYETATENSPVGSFEMPNYESNYLLADVYACKRRKQSDSSNYSIESQDSIDCSDIFVKSIKLHNNGEYITMKELDRESSTSSHLSMDMDIPFIDAEELPVIKPSPEVIKRSFSVTRDDNIEDPDEKYIDLKLNPAINQSDSSETFVTACSDMTPISDAQEPGLSPPKSSGLSKSPTVLKNLSNFELFSTVSESILNNRAGAFSRNQTLEEDEKENYNNETNDEEEESTILKLTSSDGSEISDIVSYATVKSEPSNNLFSSDCDSDTYVTIPSDKLPLERKFSDLSEASSSPYNTPPDTSSASFCTPPDTYSPILSRLAKRLESDSYSNPEQSPPFRYDRNLSPYNSPTCSSPRKKNSPGEEPEGEVTIYNIDDSNFPPEGGENKKRKELIMFESPKLEFYETDDSIENLEAFLKTEEGLQELVRTPLGNDRSWKFPTLEDLQEEPAEPKISDAEEGLLSKTNSLEHAGDSKLFEKRGKRHPPLSRQNSTEEYNFLEPHDSCLNLSEEISSPSTTPDTSNKTVIFKNKPLTVSNTIDLDDDDFPISDSEIQIHFNGSETEILEIPGGGCGPASKRMSNQSIEVWEDQGLNKTSEDNISSPTGKINDEHQTIHGNVVPKTPGDSSKPNHTNGEPESSADADVEVVALNLDHTDETSSNLDDGVDVGGGVALSEEELEKKFQDVIFAFRTDMMMLSKRLSVRKRLRDQAERNVEKEILLMKSKLHNLKYLCFDSDSLEQLTDLKRHLDIILASVNYLSNCSEAYGFVQNEEKMSGALTVITKRIESIERAQSEMSKSSELEKSNSKRILLLSILDDERREEKMVRRRSIASLAANGTARRRASIASVPRNGGQFEDSNGRQSISPIIQNRNSVCVNKKVSTCQSSTPKSISPLAAGEQTNVRSRKESRIGDHRYGMKLLEDYNSSKGISDESASLLPSSDDEMQNDDKNDKALAVLRMPGSFVNRMGTNSFGAETQNLIDSLRKVLNWNVVLIRNSRFQLPESMHRYLPFSITWYVIILVLAIFTTGFFTDFRQCFNPELLYFYLIISGIVTFWITVISMMLKFKPVKLIMVSAFLTYVFSLNRTLQEGGIPALFERLGKNKTIKPTSNIPSPC